MPVVDALVVNYRTGELAAEASRAVAAPGTRVLVCDNSGELSRSDLPPGTELLSPGRNTMFAGGNDLLFAMSSSPYVLLLNPDVVCPPEVVTQLRQVLDGDPDAWAAAPRLLDPDGSDQDYVRRFPTTASMLCDRVPPLRRLLRGTWAMHVYADLDPTLTQPVDSPPGACLLLLRDAVGPALFDEGLPLFFNDTDLARRMHERGRHVLLVGHLTVTHLRHASLDQGRTVHRYAMSLSYDRSARRYARRWLRAWPLLWAVSFSRELVARGLGARHLDQSPAPPRDGS